METKDGRIITCGYVLVEGYTRTARQVTHPDGRVEFQDANFRTVRDPRVTSTFGDLAPQRGA